MTTEVIVNEGENNSPEDEASAAATSTAEVAAAVATAANSQIAGAVALQQLANDSGNPEVLGAIRELSVKVDGVFDTLNSLAIQEQSNSTALATIVEEAAEEAEELEEETQSEVEEIPEQLEESTDEAINEIPAIQERRARRSFWL